MTKIIVFVIFLTVIFQSSAQAQKKYGYAVMYLRCGDEDPQKDRVYFSPMIELNALNFPKYTDGIDPAIPPQSVRYYNYAISRWFEHFLKQYYRVAINDPDKYERKFRSFIFNDTGGAQCNNDKTNIPCFFTDKNQLSLMRENAIRESKLPESEMNHCEVIAL